jgi:hypothetical protein
LEDGEYYITLDFAYLIVARKWYYMRASRDYTKSFLLLEGEGGERAIISGPSEDLNRSTGFLRDVFTH